MTEENNNQPAIPPNNYQNHLIWRNIFIYIILPIQFVGNLSGPYHPILYIIKNEATFYDIIVFCGSILTFFSILLVIWGSLKKRPIGYKMIRFYSIFIIFYTIIHFIFEIIAYNYFKIEDPIIAENFITNHLTTEILTALLYIITAIANLIYFRHRKFLFGIPDEQSTPPESKEEESKENHQ